MFERLRPMLTVLRVAIVTTSLGGVTLNDGEVAVEVRSTSEAEDRAFLQLFVRLQGGRAGFNGYNVTWSPSLGWAALRRMREGEGTTLAERTDLPPVSLADGATVAVRVQGPTFWLLVNGDVLLSGTDPAEDAIDSGRLGLGVIREGHTDDDDELRVT